MRGIQTMNIKKLAMVVAISVLLILPSIASANPSRQYALSVNDDVEIYITGGFGVSFTIVNHGYRNVTANYTLQCDGLIPNKYRDMDGKMFCPYEIEESTLTFYLPYAFIPVTATMSVDNKTLSRTGFILMGFAVFITSE